jgi:long-chain fatty acid transport protein
MDRGGEAMNKRILGLLAVSVSVLPSLVLANGLSLNGLGSRAQGMGGAFVSIANDFSAVFWNPAGAAGFRKETFGFSLADVVPRATLGLTLVTIPENPPFEAKTATSHYLNFLAGYYKPVGSNVVLGIGIGTPSAQGTMWNGSDLSVLTPGTTYDFSSRLYVFSFSPMAAVRISERLSVGAAINVSIGTLSLKMPAGTSSFPPHLDVLPRAGLADLGQYEETMTGWGLGATFGILAKPADALGIGLTVRTPSTITFDGSARMTNMTLFELPGSSDLRRKIVWPLSIAGGVSFQASESLLLSADVQWTQWSKLDVIRTTFMDPVWAQLTSLEGRDVRVLDWKDATQIRFGAEYAVNSSTAVRIGYTYDPAPGPDATLDILMPTFANNAIAFGLGKTFGGLQLDFCLEYLAGSERPMTYFYRGFELDLTGTLGMHAFVPSVSASYKF